MNSFVYLTSKDPEKQCHYIKPFTSKKLNSEVLTNGNVRSKEAIDKLKNRIVNINNAKQGVLDICCKNIVNQEYDKSILNELRELYPSIREIKESNKLKYIELSLTPINEPNKGWQQLAPYHVCKLKNFNIKPTDDPNIFIAENLVEDCYTSNCDNQDTITLEGLMREETNPIEYSYYDDLKMYQSIEDGNMDYIKKYLFKYNEINRVLTNDDLGNYIIHIATKFYKKNIYDLILALKPDINVVNVYGNTPLHIACLNGQIEAINELLKLGAYVNIKNKKGMNPLMMAMEIKVNKNDINNPMNDFRLTKLAIIIKTLIRAGIDINAVNNNNENLLHILIKKGDTHKHLSSIVRMLMEYGIDVNIKNNDGITPLELASKEIKNINSKKIIEPFNVKIINEKNLTPRQIELKEIQTMLFNQILRTNADKYSTYINVKEIPKGAPIEVLNYVCSGDNPEILGIENKTQCEKLGGIFTKVKNPTTKVKLELLPESDKRIIAEDQEDLYYEKFPDSVLKKDLPEEIKMINQQKKYNNIKGNSMGKHEKNINNDTFIDRDNMINTSNNLNNNKNQNKHKKNNKKNDMLLNNIETEHPVISSASDISKSVNDAFNNSNNFMIGVKSNISKNEFIKKKKTFIKENWLGLVIILILILCLFFLYK
jgi:ankyrin repeat protein